MRAIRDKEVRRDKLLFFISILILVLFTLLVLPSSPLRSGNTWDDANAMLRIGQLWMNGTLPFRDVFEQRGLVMYLIYFIANLFSSHGYVGLYIVELMNLLAILVLSKLVISNFFNGDRQLQSSIGALITVLLIMTNYSFKNGGSPEEFSLPWILMSILYVQRYAKKQNARYFIPVGIGLAMVFNIKYSLIGPWIALGIISFYLIFRFRENIFKKIMMVLGYGALGLLVVFVPIVIYLMVTHSTEAFINAYFIENLSGYTKESLPLMGHMVESLGMGLRELASKNVVLTLAFFLATLALKDRSKAVAVHLIFIMTMMLSYWALRPMDYMVLILVFEMYFTIVLSLSQYLNIINVELYLGAITIAFGLFTFVSSNLNPSFKLATFGSPNADVVSSRFADRIDQLGGAKSLLYYNTIDFGVERYTSIPGSFRYFERTNLKLKEKDVEMDSIVKKGRADFIIVNDNNVHRDLMKKYKVVETGYIIKYNFYNNRSATENKVKLYLMQKK